MKLSKLCSSILVLNLIFLGQASAQAQQANVKVEQNKKLVRLMEVKTQMNQENKIGDRYVIQLYYGDNQKASEIIREYRSLYNYPSEVGYEEPNFKVWVGRFRNRLEADRALLKIKEHFPTAFIPKLQNR